MKTHTIRGKATPRPVVTFTPNFFARMLGSQPEAVTLMLHWFRNEYKALTGKTLVLAYEQQLALEARCGADAAGAWRTALDGLPVMAHAINAVFIRGVERSASLGGLEDVLALSEAFYTMLLESFKEKAAPAGTDCTRQD